MVAAIEPDAWLAVLVLASLSVVSTGLGIGVAVWAGPRPLLRAAGIGFSVGVMVAIAFAGLLPEAVGQAGVVAAVGWALAGAALLAALNVAVPHVHLFDEARGTVAVRRSYLVAFGLVLHDFPEGFAMANAYLSSPQLGVVVALAIVLHNIPEEFAMALPAVLVHRPKVLLGAAVASAAAEPLGALIGLAAVSVSPGLNAAFLALAAGAMAFVSFHELVPVGRELGRPRDTAAGTVVGVGVVLALGALVGS